MPTSYERGKRRDSATSPSLSNLLLASYLEREAGPLGEVEATTLELRRLLLNRHVVPALGPKTKAVDVEAAHLRQMIDKLKLKGLAGASIRACLTSASAMSPRQQEPQRDPPVSMPGLGQG